MRAAAAQPIAAVKLAAPWALVPGAALVSGALATEPGGCVPSFVEPLRERRCTGHCPRLTLRK